MYVYIYSLQGRRSRVFKMRLGSSQPQGIRQKKSQALIRNSLKTKNWYFIIQHACSYFIAYLSLFCLFVCTEHCFAAAECEVLEGGTQGSKGHCTPCSGAARMLENYKVSQNKY